MAAAVPDPFAVSLTKAVLEDDATELKRLLQMPGAEVAQSALSCMLPPFQAPALLMGVARGCTHAGEKLRH